MALHLAHIAQVPLVLRHGRRRPLSLVLLLCRKGTRGQGQEATSIPIRDQDEQRRRTELYGRGSVLCHLCLARPAVSLLEFERQRQRLAIARSVSKSLRGSGMRR